MPEYDILLASRRSVHKCRFWHGRVYLYQLMFVKHLHLRQYLQDMEKIGNYSQLPFFPFCIITVPLPPPSFAFKVPIAFPCSLSLSLSLFRASTVRPRGLIHVHQGFQVLR
jgi:hypothetical protein